MTLVSRRLLILALALLVVVAVAAAACGDGSDTGAVASSGPKVVAKANDAAKPTTAPGGPALAPTAEIDQNNMTFIPGKVSMKAGETVLIKNSESVIHTANINGKNISGNMKKGDAVPWRAEAPGEYKVTCDYHPQMKATIVVGS